MAFTTIEDNELIDLGVTGLPDTPELSAEDMQAQFDEYPKFLKDKFKTHIAEEEAETAAANVGAKIPDELADMLENLTEEQIAALKKVQPILDELAKRSKDMKDWQDAADENFTPSEINTAVFHADNEVVIAPTVDTLDVSNKVATTEYVDNKMQAIGAGDMAKSTYDPNDRGMVETAYEVKDSKVSEIEDIEESLPELEAGDDVKTLFGKVKKYLSDLGVEISGFGTCTTAAATAAKEITISGEWELKNGSFVAVLFSNTNTAQNPTFNVNNTGAKSVWYDSAVITDSNISYAGTSGRPMLYMYDGTRYVFLGWSKDWKSSIDAINNDINGLRNNLTNISITGTTNDTGSTIAKGRFFYLNGELVRAKADIANGATLTLNTNYEVVTAGGLNKLDDDITSLRSSLNSFIFSEVRSVATDSNGLAYIGTKSGYTLFASSVNPMSTGQDWIITEIAVRKSGAAAASEGTYALKIRDANTDQKVTGATDFSVVLWWIKQF